MNTLPVCEIPAREIAVKNLALPDVMQRFRREAEWLEYDTGRYRCRLFTWGSGPPLIFIPGLMDDPLSYILPISLLKSSFQCIAYNLPTGKKDGARLIRYRHNDLKDDLLELLNRMNLERVYLFGSSFGSTIALSAMASAPSRFPRAVLQGGFAQRKLASAELLLARLFCYVPGSMRWFPFRKSKLKIDYHEEFQRHEPDLWRFFVEQYSRPPMAAIARRLLLLHRTDLRHILPEIRQPVLLACGQHDPLIDRECENVLLQGLPRALRIEIGGCGHFPYFTHPEILAELVRRFLTPPLCQMPG